MAAVDVNIETLLPHRGMMLLIADIISLDQQKATTLSLVKKDWPLSNQQGVNALIIVELVAQTAGIYNSYEVVKKEGADSNVQGWIVGIKKASFVVDYLPFGASVQTTAHNQFEYDELREIYGESKIGDQVLGQVTLQLMRAQ